MISVSVRAFFASSIILVASTVMAVASIEVESPEGCSDVDVNMKANLSCDTLAEFETATGTVWTRWIPESPPMSYDWEFTYSAGAIAEITIDDLRYAARAFSHPDSTRNALGYNRSDLGLLWDYFHVSHWDDRTFDDPEYVTEGGTRFVLAGERQWNEETQTPAIYDYCCENYPSAEEPCVFVVDEQYWCDPDPPLSTTPVVARNHFDIVLRTQEEAKTIKLLCGMGTTSGAVASQYDVIGFPADEGENLGDPGKQFLHNAATLGIGGLGGSTDGGWHTLLAHELTHVIEDDGIMFAPVNPTSAGTQLGRPTNELVAQYGKFIVGHTQSGQAEFPYGATHRGDGDDMGPGYTRYQNYLLWAAYLAGHFTQGTASIEDDLVRTLVTQVNAMESGQYIMTDDAPRNNPEMSALAGLLEDATYDDPAAYPYLQGLGASPSVGDNRLERIFVNYGVAIVANRPDLADGQYGFAQPEFIATDVLPLFEDTKCGFSNATSIPPRFLVDISTETTPGFFQGPYSPGDPGVPCSCDCLPGCPQSECDPKIPAVNLEVFGWAHDYLIFDADTSLADGGCKALLVDLVGTGPMPSTSYTNHLSANAILYGDVVGEKVWDQEGAIIDIIPLSVTTDINGITSISGEIECFGDVVKHAIVVITMVEKSNTSLLEDVAAWEYTVEYEIEAGAVDAVVQDKSAETLVAFAGKPYSILGIDQNSDGQRDIFVSVASGTGSSSFHPMNVLSADGVPTYLSALGNQRFELGDEPFLGMRGVAVADFNNDTHLDMFVAASGSPRLYENDGASFEDRAADYGLEILAGESWVGAWGDYDRDGDLDLFVGRGYATGEPTPSNTAALQDRLFRNDINESGGFVDVSASAGIDQDLARQDCTLGASWADFDGDGDLDLVTARIIDNLPTGPPGGPEHGSLIYVNQGDGTFVESSDTLLDSNANLANGVLWVDVDGDSDLDLVFSTQGSGNLGGLRLYENDGGSLNYLGNTRGLLEGEPTVGVAQLDHDLDGQIDLVGIPESQLVVPRLFISQESPVGPYFVDRGIAAGASAAASGGVFVADFNGDGDSDLLLGRADTDPFFLRTRSASGSENLGNNYAAFFLAARNDDGSWDGGNNIWGVGATIKVESPSTTPARIQTRVVDGGSGRGGQSDWVQVIGLGSDTSAQVTVRWPDGFEQVETLSAIGTEVNNGQNPYEIRDQHSPTLVDTSVVGTKELVPGGLVNWEFSWETEFSSNPAYDRVYVQLPSKGAPCYSPAVLAPGDPDVVHAYETKPGGGYVHTVRWENQVCPGACGLLFTVESGFEDTSRKAQSNPSSAKITVCVP